MIGHIIVPLFFIRLFLYWWQMFVNIIFSHCVIVHHMLCYFFFFFWSKMFTLISPILLCSEFYPFSLQEEGFLFPLPPHVCCLVIGPAQQMWQKWCYEARRTGHPEALQVHLPYWHALGGSCAEAWELRMTAKAPHPTGGTACQASERGHLELSSSSNLPAEQRHMNEPTWHSWEATQPTHRIVRNSE